MIFRRRPHGAFHKGEQYVSVGLDEGRQQDSQSSRTSTIRLSSVSCQPSPNFHPTRLQCLQHREMPLLQPLFAVMADVPLAPLSPFMGQEARCNISWPESTDSDLIEVVLFMSGRLCAEIASCPTVDHRYVESGEPRANPRYPE